MPKFIVTMARDLSEYTDVEIEADDIDEAEARAQKQVTTNPSRFVWRYGNDREDTYIADSEEVK